ncbi:PP2C family protein-serine/threonine phosphatase [Streptomyces sp. PA03-3a]|nr:PP2C family protein-serine/threonine phosphatase [Streptomyces sp. PA03-3a]
MTAVAPVVHQHVEAPSAQTSASLRRPAPRTRAPDSARAMAVARPMAEPAPVTIAARPDERRSAEPAGEAVLVVAAAGVGLAVSPGGVPPVTTSQAAAVLVLSVVVVVFFVRQEHHKLELAAVRAVSEMAQRVVLRPLPERIGPLCVAASYQASDAHATVGGDLYAAARITGATRILIGDVRGKGLQGIPEVAAAVGAFREAAPRCATLPEVAAHLEGSMRSHLAEAERSDDEAAERFVTALVLEIPDDRRVVHAVNCGHPAPLVTGGGRVTPLTPHRSGPPRPGRPRPPRAPPGHLPFRLGGGPPPPHRRCHRGPRPGRRLLPLRDRLARWTGTDPGGLVRHVRDDLCRHLCGPLHDDVAIVALQRTPVPAQAGSPEAEGTAACAARSDGPAHRCRCRPGPGRPPRSSPGASTAAKVR